MSSPQPASGRRLTPEERTALYETSRRTRLRVLILAPAVIALFVLLMVVVPPAATKPAAFLGTLLGIGVVVLQGRALHNLHTRLGITGEEGKAIVAEEQARRRG
ncbi:hypothetical protein [Planobispora takensis]|uniref:Transmembrane protein n=1 Tax=Planobispora takensis TaxID=1367882 RepID=A0A8J3WTH6_9ACTN|nr:hypothetical protein [Planobispora takensis]GIH98926.1 hypothetical protein Pta02_09350 [Planobispora takensis]